MTLPLILSLLLPTSAHAASPPTGIVARPCAELPQDEAARLAADFAQLCRYEKANAALPKAGPNRVVMIGDSITDFWMTDDPKFFHDDLLCRGIAGQTTSQMLLRFRADVLNLEPRIVHILAGTNDIAGNTGPTTLARIQDNLKTMVELAQARGMHVMLASLLPASAYPWRPGVQPAESIRKMNAWLKEYADMNGLVFVDYYTAMTNEKGGLLKSLSPDGVHPNPAGYAVMRPIFERALASAKLAKKPSPESSRQPAKQK